MHIAIISRGTFPGFDGPARRVTFLGAGLVKNGCEVSLVISYPPNPVECDRAFEDAHGFRYVHTLRRRYSESTGLLRKMADKLLGTAKVYGTIAAIHAVKPVDAMLLCGIGFVEMVVARSIARRFDIKLTVDKNDTNYRLKTRSRWSLYGLLSGINMALSELQLRRWSDVIFTVNRRLHEFYSKRARGRVRYIIPSFIDRRELDITPNDELFDHYDGLRLLSVVTTPYHSYGFIPFATALSALERRYEFRLYLLCSQDQETLTCVDELLVRNGLKARTTVLTRVPPEVVQSVYAGADIILNAQQEPQLAEGGFPGKTAEILASQTAIVTTLCSDLHKHYVDGLNCLVVRYDDIDAYIKAIASLCDSPELRQRLGEEGRRTALKSFEYVTGTRQLKDDFAEILPAGAGPS